MESAKKRPQQPDAGYSGHQAQIVIDRLPISGDHRVIAIIGPGSMRKRHLLETVVNGFRDKGQRPVEIIASWTTRDKPRDALDRVFYRFVSPGTFDEHGARGKLTPPGTHDDKKFACERTDVAEILGRRHGLIMLDAETAAVWAQMLPPARLSIVRVTKLPSSSEVPSSQRMRVALDVAYDPEDPASFQAAVDKITTYIESLRA